MNVWDTVQHITLAMHRGHRERERDILNDTLWFQLSLLRNQLVSEEAFSDATYTKGLPAGVLSSLKNDVNLKAKSRALFLCFLGVLITTFQGNLLCSNS